MANPVTAPNDVRHFYAMGVQAQQAVLGTLRNREEPALAPMERDALLRYEAAAQQAYWAAVVGSRRSGDQPWVVNVPASEKDFGRDAAYNFSSLSAAKATRAMSVIYSPGVNVAVRSALVNGASVQFGRAMDGYDIARRDQDGRLNDSISAHIGYAGAAVGLAGARTATGFDVGPIELRLAGGTLQVRSQQLQQLDLAAAALQTAREREAQASRERRVLPDHDVQAARTITAMMATERAQRLATVTALTQGAIAALSPATQGLVHPLTAGQYEALGHQAAFAVSIRRAVESAQGPDGEALRALYRDPTAWRRAWGAILDAQIAGADSLPAEIRNVDALRANVATARGIMQQIRTGR